MKNYTGAGATMRQLKGQSRGRRSGIALEAVVAKELDFGRGQLRHMMLTCHQKGKGAMEACVKGCCRIRVDLTHRRW